MTTKTLDLTPTWSSLLPALLLVLKDGNAEGKATAKQELERMAQAADNWNEHCNTNTNYHNASFAEHMAGKFKDYDTLAYTIEKNRDPEIDAYELSIISTSLSELEGSDEGILECYSYFDKQEAEQDIEQAQKDYEINLDEV